ncbi:galactosylceramide sulfotransferase isoform 3-T3 [Syngnathus typhle]
MLRMTGNKCTTITRGLLLWLLLIHILVLLYCLMLPTHEDFRSSKDDTCPLNMAKPLNKNLPRSSRRLQTDTCSPSVNIMFLKTHKTASSTLLNILFRFGEKHKLKFAFPDGRNDFFYPSAFSRWQVKSYRPGECFNILCNHMRFCPGEVAALLPLDATYVTILRDPAHLLESAFHYYHRAVPFTWSVGGDDKLEEFLRSPRTYYRAHAYNAFYLKNLLLFDLGSDNNLDADHPDVTEAIQGDPVLEHGGYFVLQTQRSGELVCLSSDPGVQGPGFGMEWRRLEALSTLQRYLVGQGGGVRAREDEAGRGRAPTEECRDENIVLGRWRGGESAGHSRPTLSALAAPGREVHPGI